MGQIKYHLIFESLGRTVHHYKQNNVTAGTVLLWRDTYIIIYVYLSHTTNCWREFMILLYSYRIYPRDLTQMEDCGYTKTITKTVKFDMT